MNKKTILVVTALAVLVPFFAVKADRGGDRPDRGEGWREHIGDMMKFWRGERSGDEEKGPGTPWGRWEEDNTNSNLNDNNGSWSQPFFRNRCEGIQNRIDNYENNHSPYDVTYGNIKERLDRLVDRLGSRGADTTGLKSNIDTLNGKIDTLKSDYQKYIEELKNAKDSVCSNNDNSSKPDYSSARTAFQQFRKDRQDIRDYFHSTIQPELQKIRHSIKDDNGNSNDNFSKD